MSPQSFAAFLPIELLEARRLLSSGSTVDAIPIDLEAGAHLSGKFDNQPAVRFSFKAIAGESYFFSEPQEFGSLSLLSDDGQTQLAAADRVHIHFGEQTLQWTAPRTGTFLLNLDSEPYATSYNVLARAIHDDHSDAADAATPIDVGSLTPAHIDSADDVDWFSFEGQAGQSYLVRERGYELLPATVSIYGSDGKTLIAVQSFDPYVSFKAPSDGVYYIKATGSLPSANLYTLELDAIDDAGNSPASAPLWDLNSTIYGDLESETPHYFRFVAQAGEAFLFNSTEQKHIGILDSDGKTELGYLYIFDHSDIPSPGTLMWTAPHAGTYYVKVSGYLGGMFEVHDGPYSLTAYPVTEEKSPDDGSWIAPGQSLQRKFESPADVQYFRFEGKAGTIYSFSVPVGDFESRII